MILELRTWVQFLLGHVFSSATCNNSHLSGYSLSTYMVRACDRNLTVGEILDYIIRCLLTLSISTEFYGLTDRRVSKSLYLMPRSYK
jgi:hypothetical protein